MRPLEGMRVVELGQYIAGPYCALLLADQGAEVIKVERPATGDPRRGYDPLVKGDAGQMSGGFLSYNRNKKSVALDVSKPHDRELYLELAATADVVVENLRVGAVERLAIDYSVLSEINPRLIYAGISGYGRLPSHQGPYKDLPAFDTAIQAMGGVMAVTGEPDGPPTPAVTGLADIYTATHAALGVMTAMHARSMTGRGTFVDQSMYDAVASLLERELMLWDFTHTPRLRGVDRYAPLGALQAKDGYVALIIPTDEMWRRMCEAIERPDLLNHPKLSSVIDRATNFTSDLKPEAERWTRTRTRGEIVERFSDGGLPVGKVQELEEIYSCLHLQARGMFLDIEDAYAGHHRMIRTPMLLAGYDTPSAASAPQLGENNEEILGNLMGATPQEDRARAGEGAAHASGGLT